MIAPGVLNSLVGRKACNVDAAYPIDAVYVPVFYEIRWVEVAAMKLLDLWDVIVCKTSFYILFVANGGGIDVCSNLEIGGQHPSEHSYVLSLNY